MKITYVSLFSFFLIISLFVFSPVYAQDSQNDSEYISASLVGTPEDIEVALNDTRQFLIDNPYHREQRVNECAFLVELKWLDEAETCLEKAVSDFPNDPVLMGNLAALYFYRGDFASAKTQSAIAHNLDPDDIIIHSNLLSARIMIGDDSDEILQELDKLIDKDSSVVNLFLTTAKLLNDKNRPSEARIFLEQIPITNDTSVNVFTQFGISYALEKNFLNAEKYLLEGYQKNPYDIGILKNLGTMYYNLGGETNNIQDYQKAIEFYKKVLEIDPDNKVANRGITDSYDKIYVLLNLQLAIFTVGVFSIAIGTLILYYKKYRNLLRLKQQDPTIPNKAKILRDLIFYRLISVFLTGFLTIPLILIAVSLIAQIQIIDGNDISNWAAMVVEVTIGVTVAALILSYELSKQDKSDEKQNEISNLVDSTNSLSTQTQNIVNQVQKMIEEQHESSKIKERLERQHYKDRLTTELERLISLTDVISSLHSIMGKNKDDPKKVAIDQHSVDLNRVHAVTCLERLQAINSEFNIPSDIRGKFDQILSYYESWLESIEHNCFGIGRTNNTNVEFAKEVRDFLANDFFKDNNSEITLDKLKKLNELISKIIKNSKN